MIKDYLVNFVRNYLDECELRAALQLIPGWSSIDTELSLRFEKIKKEKMKVFFDELSKGNFVLTKEMIDSNEFLHCFFITNNYALKTKKEEKVKLFANFLKSSLESDLLKDTDEYEEYLEILYELSYREFQLLCILRKYENEYHIDDYKNECDRAINFWNDFKKELNQNLKIDENEIDFLLVRLTRTGCYESFTGKFWNENETGQTTQIFDKLMNVIEYKK